MSCEIKRYLSALAVCSKACLPALDCLGQEGNVKTLRISGLMALIIAPNYQAMCLI